MSPLPGLELAAFGKAHPCLTTCSRPLFTETAWRVQGFVVGLGAADASNTSFRLLLAALVWAIHAWLGYWLLRPGGSRAWLALLPVGLALAANAFFAERQALFVGGYLALLLITCWRWCMCVRRWRGWEQHGSDYATELAFRAWPRPGTCFHHADACHRGPVADPGACPRAFWEVTTRPWQAVAGPRPRRLPWHHPPGVLTIDRHSPCQRPAAPGVGLGTGPDLAENKLFRIAISNYQTENWTPD